jgi:hypothetical protein
MPGNNALWSTDVVGVSWAFAICSGWQWTQIVRDGVSDGVRWMKIRPTLLTEKFIEEAPRVRLRQATLTLLVKRVEVFER